MNRIFILLLVILSNMTVRSQVDCKMDVDKRHDTIYKRGDTISYSGKYEEYYPGNLKIKGTFLNGLKNGEFTYYSWDNLTDSIVNYKNGKRNGIKKSYDPDGYPDFTENYVNDTLDGNCSYWAMGGQLDAIITYDMGKKIKITGCEYNDSIGLIKCRIIGLSDYYITKSFFESMDTLKVALYNYKEIDTSYSISELLGYKIISFSYSIIGDDAVQEGDSPIIVDKHKSFINGTIFKGIEISDLYIENPCGQKYYLPSVLYICKYWLKK